MEWDFLKEKFLSGEKLLLAEQLEMLRHSEAVKLLKIYLRDYGFLCYEA